MAKKDLRTSLGAILDTAYASVSLVQPGEVAVSSAAACAEEGRELGEGVRCTIHSAGMVVSGPGANDKQNCVPGNNANLEEVSVGPVASIHPSSQPSIPNIRPASHSSVHSSDYPSIHPTQHPTSPLTLQPSIQPVAGVATYLPLTPNQGKVLLYLLGVGACETNVEMVSRSTDVPLGTVKDALRALTRYGYIIGKWRIVRHSFHGFGYSLDHKNCSDYVAGVMAQEPSSIHPSLPTRGSLVVSWLSVTWTFQPFVINHRERRKEDAQKASQLHPRRESLHSQTSPDRPRADLRTL